MNSQSSLLNKTVALIRGGLGAEREISLLSAEAVAKSFDALNISYERVEADKKLPNRLIQLQPDLAFLAVHGKYAEEGTVQGICEYLKIPYTGSGILSSALCMDKSHFKNYISNYQIPTAQYQNLDLKNKDLKTCKIKLSLPFVIKPSREGSTIGISICKKEEEVLPALKEALKYDTKLVVERYIEGMEVAVSFLLGKVLTPVEILPEEKFYNYKSKYQSEKTRYILPPRLDQKVQEECQEITRKIAQALGIQSYCRADFIVKDSCPYMIEMNTLPGLTTHSLLPKSAKHDGIDFKNLVLKILENAQLDYSF